MIFPGGRDLVRLARQRIQDEGGNAWSDAEVLDGVNQEFRTIQTTIKMAGEDHLLSRMDVPVASFTEIDRLWYEYVLPEYVEAPRRIEAKRGGMLLPITLQETKIESRDLARGFFRAGLPMWFYSGDSHPGKISVVGEINRYSTITIWFIRQIAPIHYGQLVGVPTVTTADLDTSASTRVGDLIIRPSWYEGLRILFESGTQAGQIRRIETWDGTTATWTDPLGVAPIATDQYSLVLPIHPNHVEYLLAEVANHFFYRAGNESYIAMLAPRLGMLKERFKAALNRRSADAPKRMWTHRR